MKVLILAGLVALALAGEKEDVNASTETSDSRSVSEEYVTHIKQKFAKAQHLEQLLNEADLQNKALPFIQPQPLAYPFAQPISCTPLAQNIPSVAQSAVAPSPLLSEVEQILKSKSTILPKHQQMPIPNSPTVLSLLNNQIPSAATPENQNLPLSLLQLLAHQSSQAFPQTFVVPAQPQLSLVQPKAQLLQQVVPFLQSERSLQALLQYLDLLNNTHQFPATQPIAPVVV